MDADAILKQAAAEKWAKGPAKDVVTYCNRVLEWARAERAAGRADGTTSRLAILAAELMTAEQQVPEEQIRWKAFATEYSIPNAVQSVVSTLPRQMALEAMEQATKDMDDGTAKNVDVRAGYYAARLVAKDRPKLKMDAINDWLARDLAGHGLAPAELRVDEGWTFNED